MNDKTRNTVMLVAWLSILFMSIISCIMKREPSWASTILAQAVLVCELIITRPKD